MPPFSSMVGFLLLGCDLLFVAHGLPWRTGDGTGVGWLLVMVVAEEVEEEQLVVVGVVAGDGARCGRRLRLLGERGRTEQEG